MKAPKWYVLRILLVTMVLGIQGPGRDLPKQMIKTEYYFLYPCITIIILYIGLG